MKIFGSTKANQTRRQGQVLQLLIQGRTNQEMAKLLKVSERTIERDIEEVRMSFKRKVQRADLRPLQESLAEKNELWRQAWDLFNRPPREVISKSGEKMQEDDSFRKLYALDRLIKLSESKDRIAGLIEVGPRVAVQVGVGERSATEIVAGFLNQMPSELKNANIAWLRQKYGVEGRGKSVPTA
ncbi:MAG: LuxR C-terminal-related transcriptional regulator [Candidatus Bathyarchaeia archaeon]